MVLLWTSSHIHTVSYSFSSIAHNVMTSTEVIFCLWKCVLFFMCLLSFYDVMVLSPLCTLRGGQSLISEPYELLLQHCSSGFTLMDLQRHLEAMWANLTLEPDPQTPPMVQSTQGQDGTCDKGGGQRHPLPAAAVLTCVSRPGERLACANVWRISFRRGESYEGRVCLQSEREERERGSSMQTPGSHWTVSVPDEWS